MFRDAIQLLVMRRNDVSRELSERGFTETHLSLTHELTSAIESVVNQFERVISGEIELRSMPEAWQREFNKTVGQPLRHVPIGHRPEVSSAVYNLLANQVIYRSIFKYFRARPILKNIRILYSHNSVPENVESQQFHRDPEGSKQVKVFVAVREVDKWSGPLTVITREDSDSVVANDGEHIRYTDEVVSRSVPEQQWKSCIGQPGTAWLIDTSNCLHFGSRRSTSPRILIYGQLLPWYSAFLPGRDPIASGHWLNDPNVRD